MTYFTFTKVNLHSVYMEAIIGTAHHTMYDTEHRQRRRLGEQEAAVGASQDNQSILLHSANVLWDSHSLG